MAYEKIVSKSFSFFLKLHKKGTFWGIGITFTFTPSFSKAWQTDKKSLVKSGVDLVLLSFYLPWPHTSLLVLFPNDLTQVCPFGQSRGAVPWEGFGTCL